MTASPITSKQKVEFDKLLARGRKRAEKGKGSDDLQRLFARGREFEDAYVALLDRFTGKTPDYTPARSILGGDFISPEEIMTARPGIIYTDEQIAKLADMLPNEKALRWCKDNGFAVVADPPYFLSLLNIRALESDLFYSKTAGWYAEANQKFASDDKTSFGWLMIRKTKVPNSRSKNWGEQTPLLSSVECVPNAAEMSWFTTTFFKVRGVRLFENVYVRTSSVDAIGSRVFLGDFVVKGLDVNSNWDGGRYDILGVASGRKV